MGAAGEFGEPSSSGARVRAPEKRGWGQTAGSSSEDGGRQRLRLREFAVTDSLCFQLLEYRVLRIQGLSEGWAAGLPLQRLDIPQTHILTTLF